MSEIKMPEDIKNKWLARMKPENMYKGDWESPDGTKQCAIGHLVYACGGTIKEQVPHDSEGYKIGDNTDLTMPTALHLSFGHKEEIIQLNDDKYISHDTLIKYIEDNV